jgi:CRISPR-associated protein Csm1
MSVQLFLHSKILGIEDFLLSPPTDPAVLIGRSRWVTLLSEVLPRALVAELGLAKILVGTSGGGQFLVIIPAESRQAAEEILSSAAGRMNQLSHGKLRLLWAATENLGDWSVVRKRLNEEMSRKQGAPLSSRADGVFEPFSPAEPAESGADYFRGLAESVRHARSIGWWPDEPGQVAVDAGKYTWPLDEVTSEFPVARHMAPGGDEAAAADTKTLGSRAAGRRGWGVLRGDVDSFGVRLRRAQTVEEHIHLSVLYKQFFARELQFSCSLPDYWQKVSILFAGGDDFAVYGAWDALIQLGREIHRLFRRFSDENLKEFPGPEGKTLSMALAVAEPGEDLLEVYGRAGEELDRAKSSDKDGFRVFGRTLEWKRVADAAELKDTMTRLVQEFGCSPQFLSEIAAFYRDREPAGKQGPARFEKPWRFHRRLTLTMGAGGGRDREFQKVRSALVTDLIGKSAAHLKLRPAGRVALEWANRLVFKG